MDRCNYCDQDVTDETIVPAVDDDEAWAALAAEHADTCEWIETRAHRLGMRT
jgi:hypothetical protein